MTTSSYLIIDAGGTFLKSAVLAADGEVFRDSFFSVPASSEGSMEDVEAAFRACCEDAKRFCAGRGLSFDGIGVSMPGPFDYPKGVSLMQHKYRCLYRQDIAALVRRAAGADASLPVWFVHDVVCLLAGEMQFGSARGCADVAVITLGTGLGFCCAVGGEIQRTETGSPKYSLYNRPFRDGVLEDYVSKRGFLRMYGELGGSVTPSLTVKDIADRARAGDETSLRTFREVASILGEAVAPLLRDFGTQVLLFGGQISRSLPLMEGVLQEKLSGLRIAQVEDIYLSAARGVLASKNI